MVMTSVLMAVVFALFASQSLMYQRKGHKLEESKLLGDPEAGVPMFWGSQQELESSAQAYYRSLVVTIVSREVDIYNLPSQYTEDIEMFGQVLNIHDPRESMPVFSTSILGLNAVAQKQELGPEEFSTFLPANPSLKP